MAKVRFTTYVSREVYDKVKQLSVDTRVPMARYVEEALEDLLIKYKSKKKEAQA